MLYGPQTPFLHLTLYGMNSSSFDLYFHLCFYGKRKTKICFIPSFEGIYDLPVGFPEWKYFKVQCSGFRHMYCLEKLKVKGPNARGIDLLIFFSLKL